MGDSPPMSSKRVAVVVVPGVGDADTSPATALQGALAGLKDAGYTPAREPGRPAVFVVGPTDEKKAWGPKTQSTDRVPTETLDWRRDGQHAEIDLIEMPWWDLSRFPSGLPG